MDPRLSAPATSPPASRPASRSRWPRRPSRSRSARSRPAVAVATALAAGIAAATLLPCRAARAQIVASLEANAAQATYDGYLASSVLTLSPAVLFADRDTRLGVDGAFSRFETGHGSGQLGANAAFGRPITGTLRWELAGEGSSIWYRTFPVVYSGVFEPRLRLDGTHAGGWISGGAGGTTGDSVGGHGVFRGEGGAWWRSRFLVATASVAATQAGALQYNDAQAELRGEWRRLSATVVAGTRIGDRLGGVASWLNAEARVAVTRGVSLVVAGGAYPADLIRTTPGVRFVSASIRVSQAFATHAHAAVAPTPALRCRRTLRFTAPPGASVELMADFTDWRAVAMREMSPGVFEVTLPVSLLPGAHRVDIRIDGGSWAAPTELPSVADEFGGMAGALVVP